MALSRQCERASGASPVGRGAESAALIVHPSPILQFRCDEKGFLAICAFGLPGRSHEDGPARGIQAALAIVEAVKVGWREEASLTNRVAEMLAGGRDAACWPLRKQ